MEDDRPGKIFVGGLNFDIDEEEFEKIFSKFGKVTEVLLKRDQQNRRSRGFGFITYENPSDALEAVKNLDKKEVQGKMIHVDQAVKPGGDRGGRGGFRGRSSFTSRGGGGRGGFVSRGGSRGGGGGFRGRGSDRGGRGGDRGGRGGFGGRGRDFGGDRFQSRNSFSDDRYGGKSFAPRRDSLDREFSDRDSRGPPRRDDVRDRLSSSFDRDRYGSSSMSDRRPRDTYSPPRDLGSYRDYSAPSRDYSPPPRDYGSLRDSRGPSSSFDLGRDSMSSREPYHREEYRSRETRDYMPRDPSPRDYISSRDSLRGPSRDMDRGGPAIRDSFDSYSRDRMSGPPSRSYGGSTPPRRSSPGLPPRSAYSPPRGLPPREMDRDRGRGDYSPGNRRPAPYDTRGPPQKRSRPDDGPSMRGPPSRGPPRDMGGPRDSMRGRGPPRGGMRDGPRDSRPGGPPSFRR